MGKEKSEDLAVVSNYLETLASSSDPLPLRKAKQVIVATKPVGPTQYPKGSFTKEDLNFVIAQLELEKAQAESLLFEHKGDLNKAVQAYLKQ